MKSNVQLACQACFQQFKRNRNCELDADTKPNMVSKGPNVGPPLPVLCYTVS